ncbi:hypothetical protein PCC8801_2433 [Rippkaea orientalis PCC 8801]|uniref:Uncharacterized protein n=1 Tax=Rippkaea orientalis (strain PCC 8801 / RF-1) TaxID=41431 RepID=B7K2Q1_RIPO1|nr:hypothetical protein [Rippkaea orientalis]ACK66444.1 hypothetical protein PCC8801_2433 [Rippkaea orientalis PCC 8801]
MNYQSLRLLIIVATVTVWVRLFVGAVQTLTNPTQTLSNSPVATTETIQIK